MRAATPYDALGSYPDRTVPLVTFYDGAESRIELSVASVANAVAKAGSLLRDGLGVPPGAQVSVDLPRHWQLPVWVMAALSVGATVGRGLPGSVDVRILGPQGLAEVAAGRDPEADEVLGCSCDSFGLPVPGGVPPGVVDIGLEVRAYPDSFSPEPAPEALLVARGTAVPWTTGDGADDPEQGARLWVDESTPDDGLLRAVGVRPLLVGGSVVIGVGLAPDEVERIQAAEKVTDRRPDRA